MVNVMGSVPKDSGTSAYSRLVVEAVVEAIDGVIAVVEVVIEVVQAIDGVI